MAHLLLPEGAHERYGAHTTEKSRDPAMKYAAQIAFFLLLLAVGVGVYRDYGISWDEPESRTNGVVTLKYLAEHFAPSLLKGRSSDSAPLNEYMSREYGVAFDTPSVALAEMLGIREIKDVFLFRHLLTFLIYVTGIYAVERMVYRRFSDWRLSLLAALFFVLTPRLFAESFYNNKDIVLMALFAIGMNTTISFALKPGLKTAFLHACASAIAIDVRIVDNIAGRHSGNPGSQIAEERIVYPPDVSGLDGLFGVHLHFGSSDVALALGRSGPPFRSSLQEIRAYPV
jgi:hypothetical protein